MGANDTIRGLVVRAIDGDQAALKLLLTQSRADLYEFVSSRLPRHGRPLIDPDDVVQATHVSIFQRIETLRDTHPAAFHRWMKTIALNHIRNSIQLHRRVKRGGGRQIIGEDAKRWEDSTVALFNTLVSAGRTPSQSYTRREAIAAVESALSELPLHYQHAVRLTHLEGLSAKETARIMGRTERAVHGLCRRALDQLEARLAGTPDALRSTG